MKIQFGWPNTTRYFTIFIICALLITPSKGQQPVIDSLKGLLRSTTQDSTRANLLNEIAWQSRRVNPQEALRSAEQALSIGQKTNYLKGVAYSYVLIGTIGLGMGKLDESEINLQKGIVASEKTGDKSKLALAYNNLGVVKYFKGDYKEALKYYGSALTLRNDLKDQKGLTDTYLNLGIVHSNLGDFSAAIKMYDASILISREIGDSSGQADIYNSIGFIYQEQGDYAAALKNYLTSLAIKEKFAHPEASLAGTKNNIGIIYYKLHEYQTALKYLDGALKTEEKIEDKRGIALSYQNIGNVLTEQGKLEEALLKHQASLKIKEKLSDPAGMAGSYVCLGVTYEHMKNYSKAISSYSSALKLQTNINDKNTIAETIHNIGFVYLQQHDYEHAAKFLKDGLFQALAIGSRELIEQSYISLSELDSSRASTAGNKSSKALYWKNAYSYYKQYASAKDSLFNEAKTKEITRQEMSYEQDKKDALAIAEQLRKDAVAKAQVEKQRLIRNATLLVAAVLVLAAIVGFLFYKRKRDAEQKQKETSLSLQVSETEMKALRSQMNPHFIFNALQSIQRFLLGHQSEEANAYLLKFAKLMRLVLENSQHSEVSLKEDMQALELYMQLESIRLKHPFTYQFHIDDSINIDDDCIPPLILQPFVENAIWHGLQYKSEPGHIDIFIKKMHNALFATVEDNGVGRHISKETASPVLIKKESLGMKLTEERLKILNQLKNVNARFNVTDLFTKDRKAAGTKVELSLPLA